MRRQGGEGLLARSRGVGEPFPTCDPTYRHRAEVTLGHSAWAWGGHELQRRCRGEEVQRRGGARITDWRGCSAIHLRTHRKRMQREAHGRVAEVDGTWLRWTFDEIHICIQSFSCIHHRPLQVSSFIVKLKIRKVESGFMSRAVCQVSDASGSYGLTALGLSADCIIRLVEEEKTLTMTSQTETSVVLWIAELFQNDNQIMTTKWSRIIEITNSAVIARIAPTVGRLPLPAFPVDFSIVTS
ncbi:unnamed protein product [Closterium sp. Yama58-4]|nr:unnamed protein product [Closterium sp. Yama58-4]